jgi:uncharacterized protein (TIGR02646 family)
MFSYDQIDATTLNDNPSYSNDCWEKGIYKRVKKNLKKYYCVSQKRLCFYCKTELEVACHDEHIEHIVHKEFRPDWMFEPLNLGIACSQCNTMKGVKHALRVFARNAVTLPIGSMYYRIVHPHYDIYARHIELESNLFIKALDNDKGATTIEMCELWRPLYADRRARALSISQSDRLTIALARSQRTDIPQREINDFLEYVEELTAMI